MKGIEKCEKGERMFISHVAVSWDDVGKIHTDLS